MRLTCFPVLRVEIKSSTKAGFLEELQRGHNNCCLVIKLAGYREESCGGHQTCSKILK